MDKEYLGCIETAKKLAVNRRTLQNWGTQGNVNFIIKNGKRKYDVEDVQRYITQKIAILEDKKAKEIIVEPVDNRKGICYTRIKTEDDTFLIKYHINTLKAKYPDYEMIYDVCDSFSGSRLFNDIMASEKLSDIKHLVLYNSMLLPSSLAEYVSAICIKSNIKLTILN